MAAKFAEAGFQVTGIDIQEDKVRMINSGESPIKGDEPGLDDLVKKMIAASIEVAEGSHLRWPATDSSARPWITP